MIDDLNIINNNISQNEIEEIENRKKKEKEDIERYNKLLDKPKNPEDPLIKKERETILENYYRDTNVKRRIRKGEKKIRTRKKKDARYSR